MSDHQVDGIIAILRTAIDALEDMKKPSTEAPVTGRAIAVPWLSQLGPGAGFSNSDCGPACVAMLVQFLGKAPVTVDQVSAATHLVKGYKFTLPAHLMTAGEAFGVRLRRQLNLSIEALRREVDNDRPAIVLVHYPSLPKRYDGKYTGGHWVLVTGYIAGAMLYHDPYWRDEADGKYVEIADADLARAMLNCSKDGNTANQGLVVA